MRVVAAEELPAGAARLLTAEDLLVLCRDRDDQDDDQVTILFILIAFMSETFKNCLVAKPKISRGSITPVV